MIICYLQLDCFLSQMNTLLKVMKNDKTPLLRNLIVLPLVLSPDADEGKIQI